MQSTMPVNTRLSVELPQWLLIAIAEGVVIFGRLEQEVIEIAWLMGNADYEKRLKLARKPAKDNFYEVINAVNLASPGVSLDGLIKGFNDIADERNLMVHGAWIMADDKPWVVWHKFIEDIDSVSGEFFEQPRFQRFMLKANMLLSTLRRFHNDLEKGLGIVTNAVPRSAPS